MQMAPWEKIRDSENFRHLEHDAKISVHKAYQDRVFNENILPRVPQGAEEQVRTAYYKRMGVELPGEGEQIKPWKPTIGERIKGIFPDNRAKAANEYAAREVASEEGISVEEAYRMGGEGKLLSPGRPMLNPEGRAPVQATTETLAVLAEEVPKIDEAIVNTMLRTIRGGDETVSDDGYLDRLILATEPAPPENPDSNYSSFYGMGKNFGYSGTSMGAGLLAGFAGTYASGGNPYVGAASGMAGSGFVAFRGSKDEFFDRIKTMADEMSKQSNGQSLTQEEWEATYEEFNSLANKYASWEAIPEALGNAVFLKVFSAPLKGAVKNKVADLAGRTLRAQFPEHLTETTTGLGQNRVELEAGLTKEKLSVTEAWKQQAIQTTLMGGGMSAAASAYRVVKDNIKTEVDHESDIQSEVEGVEAGQARIDQYVQDELALVEQEIAEGTLTDEAEIEARANPENILKEAQVLEASGELEQEYPSESFTERELAEAELEVDAVKAAEAELEMEAVKAEEAELEMEAVKAAETEREMDAVKAAEETVNEEVPGNTAMSDAMQQAISEQVIAPIEKSEAANDGTYAVAANDPSSEILTEEISKEIPVEATPQQEAVRKSISQMEKTVGVKINTVSSVAELPEQFKAQIESDESADKIKGFLDKESGEVYLVGENIKDESDAAKVYLHEVVGHKGIRAATGKRLDITLSRVYKSLPQDVKTRLSNKYDAQLADMHPDDQKRMLADEYIAELAETDPQNNLVQQVVATVRKWARTAFPGVEFSDQDIIELLHQGKRKLKKESAKNEVEGKTKQEESTEGKKGKILSSLKNIPEVTRKILAQDDLLLGWTMLAQHDDAFKSPVSKKTTLEGIFEDTTQKVSIKRDPDMDLDGKKVWKFTREGDPETYGYVFQKMDEIWIDVSEWGRGGGGSAIYSAVANYAFNSKKVFVGDPEGLSDDGLARRLENMASSALKFGTTEHLWPHSRQEEGSNIVPAIKWKDGDDANNIREMFKASYQAVKAQFPEIANIVYNVDRQRFEDKQGNEYTDQRFDAAAKKRRNTEEAGQRNADLRGVGSAFTVGRTTYKRSVLGQAFISGKSEEQSKLLVQLGGKLPVPLKNLLYSLDDGETRRQPFSVSPENRRKKIRRKFQDKLAPVSTTQKAITEASGEIEDSLDVRTIEDLSSGKTEQDITVFRLQHVEPLMKEMAKRKISPEELDLYLYARHAEERNEHIASINPKMQDGGSGMLTSQASKVLNKFAAEGKARNLVQLARRVDAMTKVRRDILRKHDLAEESEIDAWEESYKHYVPLKGYAENEIGVGAPRGATGKGFDIRGKESMQAMGRRTMAQSPLGSIIQDATTTMIRRRNNEVGISMLKLIRKNPNKDYWKIFSDDERDTHRVVTRSESKESKLARKEALKANLTKVRESIPEGLSKEQRDARIKKELNKLGLPKKQFKREVKEVATNMGDNYFAVKQDGKQYYVWSSDTNLINAMKNLGPERAGILVKWLGPVTRFLSSVYTSLSVGFALTNPIRDVQTAVYNALAEQEVSDGKIKGKKIVWSMVRDIPPSIRAIWRHQRQKPAKGEFQKYYKEFLEDGAKTGYYDSKDINGVVKDVQKMLVEANGGTKGSLLKFKRVALDLVEHTNTATENGVRLSSYVNARKAGVSRQKAASLAKNLTVNFNRRGELGSNLNAIYMFANASIQGTANFSRAIFSPLDSVKGKAFTNAWTGKKLNTAQKVAAGLAVSGYFWAKLSREAVGDDDDGENYWDKIPQHVRQRNFVIMKSMFGGPAEEYWKIPMPYGYNIFWVAGDNLEAAASSDSKKRKAVLGTNTLLTILGSFSPISLHASTKSDPRTQKGETVDVMKSIVKTATPSALNIIPQLAFNEDAFGTPIYRTQRDWERRSDAHQGYNSTPDTYKAISIFLNEAVGGSKYESSGTLDVHPEKFEHVLKFALGGIYSLAEDLSKTASAVKEGREIKVNNIPVMDRFAGKILPFDDKATYYDRKGRIEHIKASAKKMGNTSEGWEFKRKYADILRLEYSMKRTSSRLKKIRSQIERIESGKMDPAKKEKLINKAREREELEIDRFNRRWNETVEQ